MKKHFFALILLSFCLSIAAAASFVHEIITVSFKVGDSTLNINGEEMPVETPYVVGDGVTLVPVRVITEAFGADVEWDGHERKVILTTEEKKIELWIGKNEAKISGETISLLSAPEISNDVTMVPLRFISEGFGADVSYNNETKAISVVLDKGPEVSDGFVMYEDEEISVSLPENYTAVTRLGNGNKYIFSKKALNTRNDEYNVIHSFDFICTELSDIEEALEEDRKAQKNLVDDSYVVSALKKDDYFGAEAYSYNVSYKKKSNKFTKIVKTVYNNGENSYLTVSVYCDNINECEIVKDKSSCISYIENKELCVLIPEAFRQNAEPLTTTLDIGGKANEQIEISLYKKDGVFDENTFLENEINSYRYTVDQIRINASDIKEYDFDGHRYLGFEVSYKNGGKIYNILVNETDFVSYVKFSQDCFEMADKVISSLEFSFEEKEIDKFPHVEKTEYKTFETDAFSFELPSTFEIYDKDIEDVVVAMDAESSIVLLLRTDLSQVANETYDKGSHVTNNPLFPVYYISLDNKMDVSDLVKETAEEYEKNGWKTETARNKKHIYTDDVPIDVLKCVKRIANGIDVYLENVVLFVNTDEYELSESDKRVKDLIRMVENSDEDLDIPDQSVCVFTFAYTSTSNEKVKSKIVENLIKSFEFK